VVTGSWVTLVLDYDEGTVEITAKKKDKTKEPSKDQKQDK